MDWEGIHHFFEALSVYAGVVGVSLYGVLVPLWKRVRAIRRRERARRKGCAQ